MPEYQDAYGTDATGKPFRSEDDARQYVLMMQEKYPEGHDPIRGIGDPDNLGSWSGLPYNPNNPKDPRNAMAGQMANQAYPQWFSERAEALRRQQMQAAKDAVRRNQAWKDEGHTTPYMYPGTAAAEELRAELESWKTDATPFMYPGRTTRDARLRRGMLDFLNPPMLGTIKEFYRNKPTDESFTQRLKQSDIYKQLSAPPPTGQGGTPYEEMMRKNLPLGTQQGVYSEDEARRMDEVLRRNLQQSTTGL